MKIKVKYTHTQYKQVGNVLRQMLQVISCNEDWYSDVEAINIIEGLEHIIKKILAELLQPVKKRYTLSLNNFEIWVIVNACQNFEPQEYERILLLEIVLESNLTSMRLLEHRRNMRGNMMMEELRE